MTKYTPHMTKCTPLYHYAIAGQSNDPVEKYFLKRLSTYSFVTWQRETWGYVSERLPHGGSRIRQKVLKSETVGARSPAVKARKAFWESIPQAVRELVAALQSQGRATPGEAERVLAEIEPHFRKLDPRQKEYDKDLFSAFENTLRDEALQALRDAANKPAETAPTVAEVPENPPAVPPSLAETWNGNTVGRLTVKEWGQRILWKPKREKDAYKTPERIQFDFTAPRIWAGLALILANKGGWTDMGQEQRDSKCKTKWKDAFKGAALTRLRDSVFESKAQDEPGTSRGQFWKLKD